MRNLTEIIQNKIETTGPMSFRDFMGMALYYPGLGYYTSGKERIGKSGDYYTAPTANSLLGEMIARQLVEMWEILGSDQFAVVEYGAGDESLCCQILGWLKNHSRLYDQISYYIIEKRSAPAVNTEKKFCGKIIHVDSAGEIPPVKGCILSNEVLDNFPVHRITRREEVLELRVDSTENGFIEKAFPASEEIKNWLRKTNFNLPIGGITEICLDMDLWMQEINSILLAGFVVTIDYGNFVGENFENNGTLHCYHRHTINRNPYNNIGGQDITCDVNFSALAALGKEYGFGFTGFTTQGEFLLAMGLCDHLNREPNGTQLDSEQKVNEFLDFMMRMSRKIKVLVQHKAVQNPAISGLQFSRRAVA